MTWDVPSALPDAVAWSMLVPGAIADGAVTLRSPLDALGALAHQPLDVDQLRDLRHGRPLRATVDGERAALLRDGEVVAMAVRTGSDRWQPRVVLLGDDAS